jgi:hypothetical protein
MFNCTVPGAMATISAATHGGFHQSPSQSDSCAFLCLKYRYLHLSITKYPDQTDQPCILHILGIDRILRTEDAALTFSININCIYLPSPAYYNYPTSAKGLKIISAKFRPRQDSKRERATRLTPTRAMAPLTCEL